VYFIQEATYARRNGLSLVKSVLLAACLQALHSGERLFLVEVQKAWLSVKFHLETSQKLKVDKRMLL